MEEKNDNSDEPKNNHRGYSTVKSNDDKDYPTAKNDTMNEKTESKINQRGYSKMKSKGNSSGKLGFDKGYQSANSNVDRGYAWVILVCVFTSVACIAAWQGSITLAYNQIITRFEISATQASLVFSIATTIRMFSSPLVNILHQRTSHRVIAMIGAIIFSLSLVVMAYAQQSWMLYAGYSVLAGVGSNMAMLTCLVIIPVYFRKRRATVMGLATSGFELGCMIFSPLLALSYDWLGFTFTVMICACVAMQACVMGAMYRPLEVRQQPGVKDVEMQNLNCEKKNMECDNKVDNSEAKLAKITNDKQQDDGLEVREINNEHCDEKLIKRDGDHTDTWKNRAEFENGCATNHNKEINVEEKPLNDSSSNSERKPKKNKTGFISLFRNIKYVFLVLFTSSTMGIFNASTLHLSGLVKETCQLGQSEIALLVSLGSGFKIPSRILSGVIFDSKLIKPRRMYVFCLMGLAVGGLYVCLQFPSDMVLFAVVWCLFSCLLNATHAQLVTMFGDILSIELLPTGFATSRVLEGVTVFLYPVVVGYMKDSYGSYTYGSTVLGCVHAVISIVYMAIYHCL